MFSFEQAPSCQTDAKATQRRVPVAEPNSTCSKVLTPERVLRLQRVVGNAAMAKLQNQWAANGTDLHQLVGNQIVARQVAPAPPAESAQAATKLEQRDFDGAARDYLRCSDMQIVAAVKDLDETYLKDLRLAADRVGGDASHRLRTPILERQLRIYYDDNWDEYARLLNAFNDIDIKLKVAKLPKEGDDMTRIREAADRVNGNSSFRIRAPILERQYLLALEAGIWGDAAGYLNGFNDADITQKFLPQLGEAQLREVHDGAINRKHKRLVPFVSAELAKRVTPPLDYDVDPDDPNRPNQINLTLHDERRSPDYLDNRVQGIAVGIYLPGYLMFVDGIDEIVLLPWEYVTFGGPVPTPVAARPEATRAAALGLAKTGPPGSYAYYTATHRLTVPTTINRITCPRLTEMVDDATQQLQDGVQYELTMMAIGLAVGIFANFAAEIVGMHVEGKHAKVLEEQGKLRPKPPSEPPGGPKATEGPPSGRPALRPAQPGDLPAPLPGETPEMYAKRTLSSGETWETLPGPARQMRIDSAKREMARAQMQHSLRDPNASFSHFLTGGGYENIMVNQQLRAGAGQQGFGHGSGVRAMHGSFNPEAPVNGKTIYVEFKVPNPPVAGHVEPFAGMGEGVMWSMPEGQMLPVEVQRVGFPNGAVAERGGSKGWLLRAPGSPTTRECTLQDLLQAGKSPK